MVPLSKIAAASDNKFAFVGGENTIGVPDKMVWNSIRGDTQFSSKLKGGDGKIYNVNFVGSLVAPCYAKPINNAVTCYNTSGSRLVVRLGNNSHLPDNINLEGSFTLNRIQWWNVKTTVTESHRFNVLLSM